MLWRADSQVWCSHSVEPWVGKQFKLSLHNIQKAALQRCKCQELIACCGQEEARQVNPVWLWSSCNSLCHYTLRVDWIISAGVPNQKCLILGLFMQYSNYLAIVIVFQNDAQEDPLLHRFQLYGFFSEDSDPITVFEVHYLHQNQDPHFVQFYNGNIWQAVDKAHLYLGSGLPHSQQCCGVTGMPRQGCRPLLLSPDPK